jgi:indolepyruvate ferredoxin oxidoreductase beta subunit
MTAPRPITVLIAALGGEGGGVLTDWIVTAASNLGLPVQSTSIPGVAQRTGATTYYVEIMPVPWRELGGKRPVLALVPGIGDVDVVVASELLEAGRVVGNGFVTPDRTLVIASTHRAYAIGERVAMGDGRYDSGRLFAAIEKTARQWLLFDMDALAKEAGAIVNAVMLGAIAASGRLPIPPEAFAAAIREGGKAAEANMRGFEAGLRAAQSQAAPAGDAATKRPHGAVEALSDVEKEIAALFPAAARDVIVEGARRLAAYQDVAYARFYIDRLKRIAEIDQRAAAGGRVLRETARHLAVRMSYEDVIRVAAAKIAPDRLARIEQSMGVAPGQPYKVIEFLKPGVEEICQVLPTPVARKILALAERHDWLKRLHVGMEIDSTSIAGYLRFRALAALRRFRRTSFRYREEQASIEAWLSFIAAAAAKSPELALEIAECARLIKGYGDTFKRGVANYQAIETRVIRPAVAGQLPLQASIDAVASARSAALVDPDDDSLAKCLSEVERQSALPLAAE